MADRPTGLTMLLKRLGPHRRWMVLGLLLAAAAVGAGIGLLALSGWFIASAALAGLTPLTAHLFNLFHPSVGIRLFAIARTLARYGERIVNHDITFRILESLRTWFYLRIEPLAPALLEAYRSGDVLERIVSDIDALDNLYIRVLTPAMVALLMSALATFFFWRFDTACALTLLSGLAMAGLALPLAAERAASKAGGDLARHTGALRALTVEGLQGLAELLVFDAAERYRRDLHHRQKALIRVQARMGHIGGVTAAGLTFLSGATVTGVLFLGAGGVEAGRLDGAVLAMLGFATLAAFEIVWPLPNAFQYLSRTREAARRLTEIATREPQVRFPEPGAAQAAGAIRFEGVTFGYDPQGPAVLKDFHLHIGRGEHLAVMGATGAGKSTLVKLLARFWDPQHGRIVWGERDIRELSEAALRRSLAVVAQPSHLFNATIRDNLRLASPGADEDRLWAALAAARLDRFVAALPRRLDTWIGEAGQALSGGEARRLAVARAVLQDAPVWLLDEPTEGLDRDNERRLMETLHDLTARRTVLLITHRPVMLHAMDRIAILEDGRIVEEGAHEALLAADGHYARIWRERRR